MEFTADQSDAILRVCSYHRRDFEVSVIRTRPHEMDSVKDLLQAAFETPPASGLGNLDYLPAELHSMILLYFDMGTLFRFRQANRYARLLVTSLREYASVATHGLEGFRSLFRTGVAGCFTISELYLQLISPTCAICGAFGFFLFIPKLFRCCFDCLETSPNLSMVNTSDFAKAADISMIALHKFIREKAGTVPGIMKTLPGRYCAYGFAVRQPKYIITEDQAYDILSCFDSARQEGIEIPASADYRKDLRKLAATAFPFYEASRGTADRGVSCKACGVRCDAERSFDWHDRDKMYSAPGFLLHFMQCRESQILWYSSEYGAVSVQGSRVYEREGLQNWYDADGLPR